MKAKHFAVAVLALLMTGVLVAGQLNLSGTWNLDESKLESEGGPGGGRRGMQAQKLTINQEENKLTIERFISNEFMGDITQTEIITLDGKECENEMGFGTRTSKANWTEDGKSLTITGVMEFERDGNVFTMNSTEVYRLEDGGKVLKIDSKRTTPRGDRESVVYYNKQ